MDKFLEKLAGVLSKDDLDAFKTDIEATINERVESEKTKTALLIESQYKEKLPSLVAEEKAKLEDENKKQLIELEKHLVEQIDMCLERLIDEDFKEEVIKSFAINEALLPVFTEIKGAIGKVSNIDESSKSQIDSLKSEIETAKAQLSESIGEKMKTDAELIELKKKVYLSEKVANLSESQKSAVTNIFADKDFSFIEKNVDEFIKAISEAKNEDEKEEDDEEDEKDEKKDGEKGEKGDKKKPLVSENTDPLSDTKLIIAESANKLGLDEHTLALLRVL